jgi:hypothetical protein
MLAPEVLSTAQVGAVVESTIEKIKHVVSTTGKK